MKKTNHTRLLFCLLAACLAAIMLAVPAFAAADDDSTEETAPETTAPGEPFEEESEFLTRDVLYDKATNKQFITVQDREGNTFYIVIDYDAPVSPEEEQYRTYFLNAVDAGDLAALTGEEETKPSVCTCAEKCVPGNINGNCPVCMANPADCLGKESVPPSEEPPAPTEPAPGKKESSLYPAAIGGVILILAAGGIGLAVMLKKQKNRSGESYQPEDFDYDMDEDPKEADDPGETPEA